MLWTLLAGIIVLIFFVYNNRKNNKRKKRSGQFASHLEERLRSRSLVTSSESRERTENSKESILILFTGEAERLTLLASNLKENQIKYESYSTEGQSGLLTFWSSVARFNRWKTECGIDGITYQSYKHLHDGAI